jgi:hypothetical protein
MIKPNVGDEINKVQVPVKDVISKVHEVLEFIPRDTLSYNRYIEGWLVIAEDGNLYPIFRHHTGWKVSWAILNNW